MVLCLGWPPTFTAANAPIDWKGNRRVKTYRLLLALLVGALTVLGMLAVLSQGSEVAADVHHEWDGNWYWKDGGWIDYAPSGVPDFDQKQDYWGVGSAPGVPDWRWTYCGPVAAANSVWWFDSKFEPSPVSPPTVNDNYYLVMPYWAGLDDHDPINVIGLVDELARYFDTDGIRSGATIRGTEVHTMAYGLQRYLYDRRYYDDYHVQLVKMPTFEWVEEEVERSEDVILLLGFWEWVDPDGVPGTGDEHWRRVGGHYVTVTGINSTDLQIAFSDPYLDNAEAGGPGRVLDGTLIPHLHPGVPPDSTHNDAGNVSRDIYAVTMPATSPGGLWEIEKYPYDPADPNFGEQNCPEEFKGDQGDYGGGFIYVEVEYAIAMSPFYWKPGGEWVWLWYEGEWIWKWWWYEDDGDSCLPDFWWGLGDWEAYDGPVAVANSFWWFDSKAETLKTGGRLTEPPPAVIDHYNLIEPYGAWDDHAISNTVPFIDDLAQNYLGTGAQGTTVVSMTAGIGDYLAASGVADDFYTRTQELPSFEWVADEVETCEDVIVLLGFYEDIDGEWQRKGGHWVNAAGVNRENGLIGLSDPALNNAISPTMGLGRVFPPEHLEIPFTGDEQKEPQNISHDIYPITTIVSADQWALQGYPVTSVLMDFIGLNGGGTEVVDWGHSFAVVAEWAIGVSPCSDLEITKTAVVTQVMPGDRITYTLEYANTGLAAVDNVTITDMLPLGPLTNITYTSRPPLSASPDVTYVWTINRLSYGQSGVITITADSQASAILTNTAHITGRNAIGDPTPDREPSNNFSIIPLPEWYKWINGEPWSAGISVTVETSNTIEVMDVISTCHPFTLTEVWGSDHLTLTGYTVEPLGAGTVITSDGRLTWTMLGGQIVTLTKFFHIEPCTWTQTILEEALYVDDVLIEQRPVLIEKLLHRLWIDSVYQTEVRAGKSVTFTLLYGNTGGYENDVMIRNDFPEEAPFDSSDPPADNVDPDGLWAVWDIGDLAMDGQGSIVVTATVSAVLTPCTWITITDWIYDHVEDPADETLISLHVAETYVYLPVIVKNR